MANQSSKADEQLLLTYTGTDEMKMDGNKQSSIHWPTEHCFIFVPSQKLQVTLQFAEWHTSGRALSGEIFLVPANCICTLRNLSDQFTEVVIIRFTSLWEQLQPLQASPNTGSVYLGFHPFRMPQARVWISDFLCGADKDDPAQGFQLQSHLYGIASGFIQSNQKPKAAEQDLLSYVEHTQQHMLEKYYEVIDIEELARASGFSTTRFYQAFRRHTGLSPLKYITKIRLDASLRLLNTHSSIGEVAHQVGYSDEYYFSRLFKKQMGITPTEYAACTRIRIANLTPVFLGDLSVLGITPYLAFERGWAPEHVLKTLTASKPDIILSGPLPDDLRDRLSRIAPVTILEWKKYSWKERLLDISGLLGLTTVAERWLSHYDMKVENARIQVQNVLGTEPMLLVQSFDFGFRVYGMLMKKMNDVFYKDLQVTPALPAREIGYRDVTTMQEIADLDCENVIFLVHASTTQSRCDELEYNWRRLRRSRPKKRCLFIRHQYSLNYNAAVYENLVEETVKNLLSGGE